MEKVLTRPLEIVFSGRRNLRPFGKFLLIFVGAIILNLPFYYMLITAFKGPDELSQISGLFTLRNPTLEPMTRLLEGSRYLNATWNSCVIAGLTVVGTLIFCPLAGFAFAKLEFPGRDRLFLILLSTMMIPSSVLLIPGFLLMRDFGWINSSLPLIIPNLGSAFAVFMSRQFMSKIPTALLQAASMDGCSVLKTYWYVVLPLSRPLLASLAILTFLSSWNSFIGPMIYLFDEDKSTLPLLIALLQGRFRGQESIQMAGSLLAVLPVMVAFGCAQKQIIESFAHAGLKE